MFYVRSNEGLYYRRGEGFVSDRSKATEFPNIVEAGEAHRNTYGACIVNDRNQPVMGIRIGRGMPIASVIGGALA